MYLAILFIVVIMTGLMSYTDDSRQRWTTVVYVLTGVLLICLAAFRPAGMDNDYYTYVGSFEQYDDARVGKNYEWSFLMLSELLHRWGLHETVLFGIYATIGVTLKMVALRQLTPLLFASLCVYAGNYYILHDFTQIRAAAASGWMLLGLAQQIRGRRGWALACYATAGVFHYSALVLLGVWLLSNERLSRREQIGWAMIIPVAYALYYLHLSIPSLPIPYIGEKLEAYRTLQRSGTIDTIHVWNSLHLVRMAVYLYLLYFADLITKRVPGFPLLMKVWGLSFVAFVALTDLPVLSFRISELLGIVEIVTFPCIIYTLKPRWVGVGGIILLGLGLLYMQAFVNQILQVM